MSISSCRFVTPPQVAGVFARWQTNQHEFPAVSPQRPKRRAMYLGCVTPLVGGLEVWLEPVWRYDWFGGYLCWAGKQPNIWNQQLKYFWNFHPENWGNDPIWRAYFSSGLKPPSNKWVLNQKWGWENPPNHPFVHRVFHEIFTIHFGGKSPLFLETPK